MSFNIASLLASWRFLLDAVAMTLLLSLASIFFGFLLGVAVGTLRTYGGRNVNLVLGLYVDTMRSIPVLVILVWIFFATPIVFSVTLSPFLAAAIGLSLHIGAYFAEVVRSGLLSVRAGQIRAGMALGMSFVQILRVVLLPQALIRMLPPLGSLVTIAVKDTAIASVIAVPELMRQSQILAGQIYRPFETYTFALLVYFAICFPLARLIDQLYLRVAHKGVS